MVGNTMAQAATLPKAVRSQIRRAERIAKEAGLKNVPKDEEEEKIEAEEDDEQGTEATGDEDIDVEAEADGDSEEAGQTEREVDVEAQSGQAAEEVKPSEDNWENKYRILQGKYDAEVPRLSRQVRELSHDLQNTQSILANLNTPKEEKNEQETQQERLLRPDEIEDYGTDFIDVVKRAAREELTPFQSELTRLQQENSYLKQQVGGVTQYVADTQQDHVFAQLDATVKDWRELNTNDGFLAWLEQVDPYSGVSRKIMLRQAFDRNDAPRVVAFFKGYLNENAVVSESASRGPNGQAPTQVETGNKVDLETLAAPGKPKAGGTTSAPKEKPIWTRDQINAFYADIQKGRFRNNEKERRRIEKDIIAAGNEGRIR